MVNPRDSVRVSDSVSDGVRPTCWGYVLGFVPCSRSVVELTLSPALTYTFSSPNLHFLQPSLTLSPALTPATADPKPLYPVIGRDVVRIFDHNALERFQRRRHTRGEYKKDYLCKTTCLY